MGTSMVVHSPRPGILISHERFGLVYSTRAVDYVVSSALLRTKLSPAVFFNLI